MTLHKKTKEKQKQLEAYTSHCADCELKFLFSVTLYSVQQSPC